MVDRVHLGALLRKFRTNKNLTLQQLADSIGATASYISQLENEKSSPSINTLQQLAKVLEVKMIEFFEDELINDPIITGPNQWSKISLGGWDADVHQLVRLVGDKKMQPFFTVIKQGGGSFEHYSHSGEEFVYVLEGTLTLLYGTEVYEIPKGHSAYFPSYVEHHWRNFQEEECKVIWVCCPPSW